MTYYQSIVDNVSGIIVYGDQNELIQKYDSELFGEIIITLGREGLFSNFPYIKSIIHSFNLNDNPPDNSNEGFVVMRMEARYNDVKGLYVDKLVFRYYKFNEDNTTWYLDKNVEFGTQGLYDYSYTKGDRLFTITYLDGNEYIKGTITDKEENFYPLVAPTFAKPNGSSYQEVMLRIIRVMELIKNEEFFNNNPVETLSEIIIPGEFR